MVERDGNLIAERAAQLGRIVEETARAEAAKSGGEIEN